MIAIIHLSSSWSRGVESIEQTDFGAFERESCESVAGPCHEYFTELTTQSNDALLDTLGISQGARFFST
ncbi:hypothetical protein C0Z16_33860 [Paraburkholderia rhynchosiae]|uniref:Uncharacterized protein n=1 Tax=Paraburkholderia rhynchosiae TaxID=487049 RepID=A0ABX4UUF0_9BURK|nr:hypothetical protein C0Z16_33860 [Paraburkholderia rhynchosiae]